VASGMTTVEQIYTACVMLCIGFFLVALASFHFVIIPGSSNPGALYFVVSIVWVIVISLSATTIANLYYRSLLTIPTFVQCVILCAAIYFIPFAIWGGVLLYRRLQRAKNFV